MHITLKDFLNTKSDQPKICEIILLFSHIATDISGHTNMAGISGILGAVGETNDHGDDVQRLDVYANDLCKNRFSESPHVAAIASEEEKSIVVFDDHREANYIIAFDPLDGSSNIDVNVSIGSIFSVQKKRTDVDIHSEEQFFQKGTEQVISAYALYGASTVLVFSLNNQVYEATLESKTGEWFISREDMKLPESAKYYSVNESNYAFVSEKDQEYIDSLRSGSGLSARYIGSLVADMHRNMIKGGIFLYPAIDKSGNGEYSGKLRLLYELAPFAHLIELMGGIAHNGEERMLEIMPKSLHQREAAYLGNKITN